MNDIVMTVFSVDFIYTTIRVMTPILFAALACMVFSKGGIDAIGTEGIMLICALAGALGSYFSQSALGGVLTAAATGILLAYMFGYVTLQLKSSPILAGIALNTMASGLTIFLIYYVTGEKGSTQSLISPGVPNVRIPLLADIPVLGPMLSGHNLLTYLGILFTVLLAYFIYRTPTGLRIRSVGENEDAARSVGIHIMKYKYITLTVAGALAGLGGGFMSLGYVSFFSKEMIAGRGFIGMAAEAMGRGNPGGILLSSFIFGMADSLSVRLQMVNLPSQLVQTIPYVITIIAISVYSYRRNIIKSGKGGKSIAGMGK